MDREQTKTILRRVNAVFNQPFKDDPKFILDTWHDILKDFEFDTIKTNLDCYIKSGNEFAPKVGQLIKPPKETRDRYVPTVEETKRLLDEQEKIKEQVKNDPKVQEAREKARAEIMKMLGRG